MAMGRFIPSSVSTNPSSEQEEITIYLKVIKTVALNVKKSETIRNLKAMLREKEGISECLQELYFTGAHLEDDSKLVDCGIQKNSTVHLVLQNSGVIKLFISILSKQKTIEVEGKSHDTIQNIKSLIQAKEGIPADEYTILYAGMLLDNSRTLASLGIEGESTLHMVFNPKDVFSISVETATGDIVKTEVKALFTIGDVKAMVGGMVGFPVSDQNLTYAGKELEDSKTLAYYNIQEESILGMKLRFFQIFVRLWNGKVITLYVQQKETIADVKKKIFHKLAMPIDMMSYYLVFGGKVLEMDRDLGSYGIEKDSTVNVIFRMKTLVQPMKLSEIGFELPGITTIRNLKKIIKEKMNRPVKEVFLRGQVLQDRHTLHDYAIEKDTVMGITY